MFKEIKKTMLKELKESMKMMSHRIKNINEIEIRKWPDNNSSIKKVQELKFKNSLDGLSKKCRLEEESKQTWRQVNWGYLVWRTEIKKEWIKMNSVSESCGTP